jgi:hypothetical protein
MADGCDCNLPLGKDQGQPLEAVYPGPVTPSCSRCETEAKTDRKQGPP